MSLLTKSHSSYRLALVAGFSFLMAQTALSQEKCNYVRNGFKVGPNYARPVAPVAPDWIYSGNEQVKVETWKQRDVLWWMALNDPLLNSLIEITYSQNLTVRAAGMRILQARAQLDIAVGNLFPQFQEGFGGYARIADSLERANRGVGGSRFYGDWILGGAMIWELDFWGRFRRNVAAADARLDARIEGYDDVLVLLIADVASAYVEYRTAEQRLVYAHDNLRIQEESVRLAQIKVDAGARDSDLDLPQAQSDLADIKSLIPDLELDRRRAMNRLCVLLGMPPEDLTELLRHTSIPSPSPELAIGIPADLIRQRPDVRRAERELAAQCEEIGIAVSDLYPHIAISGTIFVNSESAGDLFKSSAWGGAVGPSFRWNLLNYGRLQANIRLQEARFNELIYNYQQVVLKANEEVENAIAAFLFSHQKVQALQVGANVSLEAVRIGSRRYQDGISNFNRLSNLQTVLAGQQDSLAFSQGAIAKSWIDVYRSMGGGWQIRLANAQPYMPGIDQAVIEEEVPTPAIDTLPPPVEEKPEKVNPFLKVPPEPQAPNEPLSTEIGPRKSVTVPEPVAAAEPADETKTPLIKRLFVWEKWPLHSIKDSLNVSFPDRSESVNLQQPRSVEAAPGSRSKSAKASDFVPGAIDRTERIAFNNSENGTRRTNVIEDRQGRAKAPTLQYTTRTASRLDSEVPKSNHAVKTIAAESPVVSHSPAMSSTGVFAENYEQWGERNVSSRNRIDGVLHHPTKLPDRDISDHAHLPSTTIPTSVSTISIIKPL